VDLAPQPSSKNFSASKPTHVSATFAADRVLPFLTIAGNATPSGMSASLTPSVSSTVFTAASTSSGSAPAASAP
jgi:hypothetical protein